MRGVGDQLTAAPSLPPCGLVLVNPGVPLATASVFRARVSENYTPGAVLPDVWDTPPQMAATLSGLTNDLEAPAISLVPTIRDALRTIADRPGCLLARMSGSGATCFGLFANPEDATVAAGELARPGWWSWGGGLAR
jgi:4-diphosphocytidyl-2-C-methyl-D-erythritol kinase